MTGRELHWKFSGQDVVARIEQTGDHGTFHSSSRSIQFRLLERTKHGGAIEIDGKFHRIFVVRDRTRYTVWWKGRTYRLERVEKGAVALAAAAGASGEITALMPGKLIRLDVSIGDSVIQKQTVAIMESMKMESALQAPKSGQVVDIRCKPGQVIEMGELIMVIE